MAQWKSPIVGMSKQRAQCPFHPDENFLLRLSWESDYLSLRKQNTRLNLFYININIFSQFDIHLFDQFIHRWVNVLSLSLSPCFFFITCLVKLQM